MNMRSKSYICLRNNRNLNTKRGWLWLVIFWLFFLHLILWLLWLLWLLWPMWLLWLRLSLSL